MMNLTFKQTVEGALAKLYEVANSALSGDFDVTVVLHRTDLEDDLGGVVAGTGDNQGALDVLEDNLSDDDSDIVVRSR